MATVKFTVQRGKIDPKSVTVAAGTAEAATDTISVNVDFTKLTKGDVVILLETIKQKILAGKWPAL